MYRFNRVKVVRAALMTIGGGMVGAALGWFSTAGSGGDGTYLGLVAGALWGLFVTLGR